MNKKKDAIKTHSNLETAKTTEISTLSAGEVAPFLPGYGRSVWRTLSEDGKI